MNRGAAAQNHIFIIPYYFHFDFINKIIGGILVLQDFQSLNSTLRMVDQNVQILPDKTGLTAPISVSGQCGSEPTLLFLNQLPGLRQEAQPLGRFVIAQHSTRSCTCDHCTVSAL